MSPLSISACSLGHGQKLDEKMFHQHCAYVMRDDFLWPALSVKENMMYVGFYSSDTHLPPLSVDERRSRPRRMR